MMAHDQDQAAQARVRELENAEKILSSRRNAAERAYDRVLTSLLVGNAGAALATVAYITANRHDGTFTRSLLVPLVLFVVGLSVPGISSLIEFESERRRTAALAKSNAVLDVQPHDASQKVQLMGWRTATALASGTCFVVGFIFCFVMLARN